MVYFLAALIIFSFIINKLSQKFSLYKLYYKRVLSDSVIETDEEFKITITVINKKILPVSFLEIEEKLPPALEYKYNAELHNRGTSSFHVARMFLLPFQRISRTYIVKGTKRGSFNFSNVELTAGDFLGVNTFDMELEYKNNILVLPKSLNIEENLMLYGNYYGDISIKRWIIEDPVIISGLHEYTGAEPEKTIHWPSSLRAGKLMVKKFDYTTDNKVLIILNVESFKPFWMKIQSEDIEKCISYTRSLMEKLQQANIPYSFVTNANMDELNSGTDMIPAGLGTMHLNNILERFACIDYSIKFTFEELISAISESLHDYTSVIAITTSVFQEYAEPLDTLSKISQRTMLITLKEDNLQKINPSILTFIERKN